MASNYASIMQGIVTVLEANVTNLKAYDYQPDSINAFPAAVCVAEPINYLEAFAGNTFTGQVRLVVLVASGDDVQGFRTLYDHIDPTASSLSVRAAIEADRSLNNTVDDSQVVRAENIGRRVINEQSYFGFDAILEFVKTVA